MSKAVDEQERLSRERNARLLDDLERARRFRRHEMAVEREEVREEVQREFLAKLRTIARNLLDMGMAPTDVSRVTELSLEAVAELEASRRP